MKKYIFSVLIALLSLPVIAQQEQLQASVVLDRTAENFRKAGGVQAEFTVKAYSNGRFEGQSAGTIQLKGEKFVVKTPETTTWFDGKTQWTYMENTDEVNVSTPTPEELQTINPYTFLNMYKNGFSSKLGKVTNFQGKPVIQVVLTATNRKQDVACIILNVTPDTYQPLYILLQQRNLKNRSEIFINSYRAGLNYADANFVFDKKQYPDAEIIDLRYIMCHISKLINY